MPARDRYHEVVKAALIKDGWTITHDPLSLLEGNPPIYIDLGAERLLAAEKGLDKIAVEIKSFLGPSGIYESYQAIGQFLSYQDALSAKQPDRVLYLAVTEKAYRSVFTIPRVRQQMIKHSVRLIIFSVSQEVLVQWIP